MTKADEERFAAVFRGHAEFDGLLRPLVTRADDLYNTASRAHSLALTKGDGSGAKKIVVPRKFEHPYAEFLYHEEHPPHLVLQKDLDRFVASTPSWFLEVLDPLCPDDARYFVQIVYRLLYPFPENMPDEARIKADAAKSDPPAKKGTTRPGLVPEKF